MELWKKDSSNDDAYYIDLLRPNQMYRSWAESFELLKFSLGNIRKNDIVSTEHRKAGNDLFKAHNWIEAIEQYNKSLRFATAGSENIGLSFANRSACFHRLQLYENSLTDIELARKANYPQNLMHKLDEREAHCSKMMKELAESNDAKKMTFELNFPPSEKFPELANVLDVQNNDEFGKHIVAKCDIDVGKVIMVEDVYAFGAGFNFEAVCKTCTKRTTNFIPCPNCADVMFCSAKCMESNGMHKQFCGALYNRQHRDMLTVESILLAVTAFPNVESLMRFSERALATRDLDAPECESIEQTKYRLFLKLFALPIDLNTAGKRIFDTYQLLMDIASIKQIFHSTKERRFLMHLIWQHHCILKTNCFGVRHATVQTDLVTLIRIHASLFNHSCVPNVLRASHGNKMVGLTIRPVRTGEQLFIEYDGSSTSHVQRTLHFRCKCSKCIPCWKLEDRIRIQSDRDFLFFQKVDFDEFDDHKKRKYFMGRFQRFFSNYGRLPWSRELAKMEVGYLVCFEKELAASE